MPFVRHYDNSFLDTLHNYFPEILYGAPEQFGGSVELVRYVQNQVRREFDLFSSGRTAFTYQVPQTPIPPQPRVMETPVRPVNIRYRETVRPPPDITRIATNLLAAFEPGYEIHGNTINMDTLNTIFGNTFGVRIPQQNLMEPVIVRPTAAQIAAGTQLEIVDSNDENCAICQDRMEAGSEARAIRACDHRFHTECIDTWFERSVACPTCRHDVRDRTAAE
jgi:hypothetical protein